MYTWDSLIFRYGDNINNFIKSLKNYRGKLPKNVLKTIKGQAIAGDIEGAKKGLGKALYKYNYLTKLEQSRAANYYS